MSKAADDQSLIKLDELPNDVGSEFLVVINGKKGLKSKQIIVGETAYFEVPTFGLPTLLSDSYFDNEGLQLYAFPKPKTILIGDMEVPAPLTEPLKMGNKYHSATDPDFILNWHCDEEDLHLLAGRFIHLTEEAAAAHYEALIKVSGGTVCK